MKRSIVWALIGIGFIVMGCNSNTYSRLRDQEDKLIANYIRRNNLVILDEEPAMDHVWAEKEYYKVKNTITCISILSRVAIPSASIPFAMIL